VRRLAERLKEAGLRVWFDEWNVRSGDIIALKVDEGLEQSRVLLLCSSPNALASGWGGLERSTAIHRDPSTAVPSVWLMKLRLDLLEHLTVEGILEEVLVNNHRYRPEPLFSRTGFGSLWLLFPDCCARFNLAPLCWNGIPLAMFGMEDRVGHMKATDLITVHPEILGGTPVFKGTRVPIQALFDYLERDYTLAEFLECFPSVSREAACAVLESREIKLLARYESPVG